MCSYHSFLLGGKNRANVDVHFLKNLRKFLWSLALKCHRVLSVTVRKLSWGWAVTSIPWRRTLWILFHTRCLISYYQERLLSLPEIILQAIILEFYMCCCYPNIWHQIKHGIWNENIFLVNIDSFFIHSNYGNKLAFSLILWLKTFTFSTNSFLVDRTLHTRVSQKKTSQRNQAKFMFGNLSVVSSGVKFD